MYSLKQQSGDFLIEAMIGTLITALVSLGTLAITSRVMLTQEEMVRQEFVVATLREELYTRDPFSAATVRCNNPNNNNKVTAARRLDFTQRGVNIAANATDGCTPLTEVYVHPVTNTPYNARIESANLNIVVPTATDPAEYELGVDPQ
ncbi:MAG TPA: hypothetical protein PK011_10825 [Marinagarivorans sp.]|nr:hypothetical protein [Cellvibrionaceae bacterium]HMY39808.1 hypothetical protein [Marinagarivorans sp.]HNG59375.1 hypothetical protein [Cellvibrionaceae bacterium]